MAPGPCQVHFHPLLLSRVQMKKAFQCLASHTPAPGPSSCCGGRMSITALSPRKRTLPAHRISRSFVAATRSGSTLVLLSCTLDRYLMPYSCPAYRDGPGPALPGWVQEAGPPRSSSSLLWQRSSILQRGGWSIHGPCSATWLSPEPPWQSLQDPCCLWGPGARRQGSFTD